MSPAQGARTFEQAVKVERVSEGADGGSSWRCRISSSYNTVSAPNGGYLMAIVLRALESSQRTEEPAQGRVLLGASFHFLSATAADAEAEVRVAGTRRGGSVRTLEATLWQGGRERVRCTSTWGLRSARAAGPGTGAEAAAGCGGAAELRFARVLAGGHSGRLGPLAAVGSAELEGLEEALQGSTPRPLFSCYRWALPAADRRAFLRMCSAPGGRGLEPGVPEFRAYIRHAAATDAISVASLAAFSDANIPTIKAVLPFGDGGWVPTLSLDLQFYGEPPPGMDWVLAHYSLHSFADGRMLEEADIFDPSTGRLLCSSRQSALYAPSARNSRL
jgi:acyl-CoA thioesterase